jgi:sugar lactone lactonase YvrE
LLWLDVDAQILHQLDRRGAHSTTDLGRRVTAVVPEVDGGLVAAVDGGVARIDESDRTMSVLATLPAAGDGVTNDARCDPLGRLWVGTVDRSGANRAGLFCVDAAGSVIKVRGEVGLSNGLDWSPDGRVCHYVDSSAHCVQNLYLDENGLPVRSETLVDIEATPDGLTVDMLGGIWVALWDGGAVHRYTPHGVLDRVVLVPGGFVTSCAFGGPELATLYITTARADLSDVELRAQPHAGGLFAADVGVTGRGYTPFGAVR